MKFNGPATLPAGHRVRRRARERAGSVQTDGFLTEFSWGYRLAARLDYANALFGGTLAPRFAFAHDVKGVGPTFNQGVEVARRSGLPGTTSASGSSTRSTPTYFGGRTYCGTDVPPPARRAAGPVGELVLQRQPAQGPRLLLVQRQLFVLTSDT